MKTWHKIVIGDSRDMGEVEDKSVHLVVTSPPYVTSRFGRGQPFDLRGYLGLVRAVFREAWRVLVPDGLTREFAEEVEAKLPRMPDLDRRRLEDYFRYIGLQKEE